jgi:hypothetical protein
MSMYLSKTGILGTTAFLAIDEPVRLPSEVAADVDGAGEYAQAAR